MFAGDGCTHSSLNVIDSTWTAKPCISVLQWRWLTAYYVRRLRDWRCGHCSSTSQCSAYLHLCARGFEYGGRKTVLSASHRIILYYASSHRSSQQKENYGYNAMFNIGTDCDLCTFYMWKPSVQKHISALIWFLPATRAIAFTHWDLQHIWKSMQSDDK